MILFLTTKLPVHLADLIPTFDQKVFLRQYCKHRKVKVAAKQLEQIKGRTHYLDEVLKLKPGSILIFNRFNTPIFHSGVYLGKDRVMHTAVPLGETEGEFLTFCNLKGFLCGNEDVAVITSSLNFMSDSEFRAHVVDYSKKVHEYSISGNNCEHLAFSTLSGFSICTRLQNPFYFSVAVIADFLRDRHIRVLRKQETSTGV
jgi:hypothetical protein